MQDMARSISAFRKKVRCTVRKEGRREHTLRKLEKLGTLYMEDGKTFKMCQDVCTFEGPEVAVRSKPGRGGGGVT